jgi:hypothetical protein
MSPLKNIKTSILPSVLFILVVGLSFLVLHFYGRSEETNSALIKKELLLRDSISILQKEINASHERQTKLQNSYDSMLMIEPQIIYKTREKIKFIYSDASTNQLDSIIRTNWKTSTGHN